MSSILVPVTLACVLHAAQLQQIPPELIVTVLDVEAGQPGMVSENSNGTEDLGPMQVNTGVWLGIVADAHFGGNHKAAYAALRDNGCYNVNIGAWILKQSIKAAGGDFYEGVGMYHSRTPSVKKRYQKRFSKAFNRLFPPAKKTAMNTPGGN